MRKSLSIAIGTLAAITSAALIAVAATGPAHADAATARTELALSVRLLKAGNYSAARSHAQAAIKADPSWGLAHAMLARSFLAIGDGVAAEGELGRARDAGFDPARAHQLYAHAWLLQGDANRALTEAAKAGAPYSGYAIRIGARALAAQGDVAGAQAALSTLLADAPKDSFAWSDLGRIKYQAGDIAGAIESAQRAVDLDADNVEAITLRGELVRGQYGLIAALPWFENALGHDAYYHPALIEYAATLGDVGRYTDMLAATRKALAARPGSPQALYLQAVLAARAGKDDLARTLLARTGGQLNAMPGARLLSGTLAYKAGAYQQAIDDWRVLVGQQPTNITARRLLGAALLRSGDPQGALDVLRPVALRADADSYTLALVARAFEQTGERDWAAKYLDRSALPSAVGSAPFGIDDGLSALNDAASAAPAEPVAQLTLIRGLIEAGDTAAALAKAQALVRLTPGAPPAYLALGDTLMAVNRYGDAADAYRHAADLRFDEPTLLRVVDALDHANRHAEAGKVLALFASQNPQNITARRLIGHWQIAAQDWDAAIDTLEELRGRIGDRDTALLAELSYAYTGAGDADTGTIYGKAAYALAPMNPAASDAYGWALYQQGKSEPALQLLEKAASIAPGRADLRWHLGQAYADLDRTAEAATQIRAALADPAFGDRVAAAAALKALG
ncbi:tetratricopeptide (TPR) repeat protein [Sphingomonas sp. BE270]|jgi:tetratricopeptide (TPR) repeat protein|uniref:tetratricopeptide repeat protein n=1 Tax=unclassified Sphingomonas TaxID=196159 RepID=UPI001AEAAB9C|nr:MULTISPECIES: tetratricopeptide repeat protein [unclassified Sphingomonas]MDR6847048.1 tetratricopeptide (TPR) repeat protein [Sphingomonas sp. BE137]MDR7256649.1 tetratricopeptide (TPR) repeat protein [Sphingomonas sp. BE270]